MKDVIVVVHATERKYLMDEYWAQVRNAGIDFHVEPVTLPEGIASMTMRWRLDYWSRMSLKFSEYDRIVFTDAWDVLFYGKKNELITKIPPILISAERNCWPDDRLASFSWSNGPWKFPNPGMMAGYPEVIAHWAEAMKVHSNLDVMDQLWCNGFSPLPIDSRTTVFYVVSADKEDGSLQTLCCDPFNNRYKTFPHFIHFAGPCHPDPFRALLRGDVDSLVSEQPERTSQ